MLTIIFGH